ncbi:MAG: hypothetical protein LBR44_08200 [Clostridiales Family XIII bacterium]|jgi:hypothetical protein|nr:hypothetical protein [Clostridiales Family XIII bacterium]
MLKKRWIRITIALVLCLATQAGLVQAHALSSEPGGGTFAYHPAADGGAADVRDLVLDAPAGKYGFVTQRGSDFAFAGTGETVRFWGVNMVFSACFPEKADADLIAEDLASLGVNLVRLHGIDSSYSKQASLFADYTKDTQQIDAGQLDKLDYFVAALKERGIYINLNLNAKRVYAPGDGLEGDPRLYGNGGPLKSAQYFDERLIWLQKDFARKLLSHENPYTGLTWAEEPAIAMIELVNEQSMFSDWASNQYDKYLKGAVADELTALYKAWVQEHYGAELAKKASVPLYATIARQPEQVALYWGEFLADTEEAFYAEMTRFLREDLGAVQPVSGNNNYAGLGDLSAQTGTDFTNAHAYIDHPLFPDGWSQENYVMQDLSLLDAGFDAGQGDFHSLFADMASTALSCKPHVVSEWCQPYPNSYEYESPLLVASVAGVQGWDAVIYFAYSHKKSSDGGKIDYWFDMRSNPAKRAQFAAAAVSFVRGDVPQAAGETVLSYTEAETLHHGTRDLWTKSLFAGSMGGGDDTADLLLSSRLTRGSFDAQKTSSVAAALDAAQDAEAAAGAAPAITWDAGKYATVDTDGLQAVIGRISGQTVGTSSLTVRMEGGAQNDAAVSLLSLDGAPARSSDRLLLTVAGAQANTSSTFRTGRTLSNWGTAPVQVQGVKGEITIKLDAAGRYTVYPLNADGGRRKAISVSASSNGLAFSLTGDTMWYEVIKSEAGKGA